MVQKILIVDDRPENLFTLEQVLGEVEAEFVRATNGNDALKESLHHDFALAILDVQMPEMDGYELAAFLRSDPSTVNLPIIFLSAVYRDDYHVFKGYESGAVDFITKPYNPKILVNKVKFFLQLDRQKADLLRAVELEKSKNYLESILFSMVDTVIVVATSGQIKITNQGGSSLIDFSQAELVGQPLARLLDDPWCIDWVMGLTATREPGDTFQNRETQLLTKTQGRIPVLLSGSALRDNGGELLGAVLVARDIRARRRLQDQLRQAQKMETIGLLAGGVAHDFNNLLTVIMGNIELAQLAQSMGERPDLHLLVDARTAALQARKLTQKFLTFHSGGSLQRKVTTVAELIQGLGPCAADFGEGHTVSLAADLWPVEVDSEKICQVLGNIIRNAEEAMAPGGTVELAAENVRWRAGAADEALPLSDGNYVRIMIRDHGVGIAPDDLPRVLDPYFSTKGMGAEKGRGLGLALAYAIVKKHNGHIQIDSEPGVGTTVWVYLPAAAGNPSPA